MARFSQDELVNAFNKYMPKRPIYPPLVYDQESCDNSSTESEGSGDEEEDYSKRMTVSIYFNTEMSPECLKAWNQAPFCKLPDVYLYDNIQVALRLALRKLVNLKVKPSNPIEWLGYCLLNINVREEILPTNDHKIKLNSDQRDFTVGATFIPELLAHVNRPSVVRHTQGKAVSIIGKRKFPSD
ncbi:hypothetical protein CRE_00718 [Caenorhabditis remanei]|uniref:Uncharacterized protein n=1 Tax=Caenorhabditis remanei TaxID=31234 RepID=E3LDZ7_CAERE|nr:hypothetical protein CRE_00718 [Caenorhabditis remanei]